MAKFADRNVQVGIATSLRQADLAAAEIYPNLGSEPLLVPTEVHRYQLSLFA